MPRMTAGKPTELELFWRAHLEGWRHSELNQREYCELHGLPLKRFGNWRAKYKHEDDVAGQKLLWRRGGGLKHMSEHVLKEISSAVSSYIPSARSGGSGRRLNFSKADKRRIVEETCREGASVSGVASGLNQRMGSGGDSRGHACVRYHGMRTSSIIILSVPDRQRLEAIVRDRNTCGSHKSYLPQKS